MWKSGALEQRFQSKAGPSRRAQEKCSTWWEQFGAVLLAEWRLESGGKLAGDRKIFWEGTLYPPKDKGNAISHNQTISNSSWCQVAEDSCKTHSDQWRWLPKSESYKSIRTGLPSMSVTIHTCPPESPKASLWQAGCDLHGPLMQSMEGAGFRGGVDEDLPNFFATQVISGWAPMLTWPLTWSLSW